MEELIKYLSLATPILYGGATYRFFRAIDAKASDAARIAISNWMQALHYDREAIAAAIREVFDRVYGSQLFSWNSLGLMALLSVIVQVAFIYELDANMFSLAGRYPVVGFGWSVQVFTNVLCDYASIFVIKKCLEFTGEKPVFALVTGLMVGAVVVRLLYVLLGFFYLTDFGANVDAGDDRVLAWIIRYRHAGPRAIASVHRRPFLAAVVRAVLVAFQASYLARSGDKMGPMISKGRTRASDRGSRLCCGGPGIRGDGLIRQDIAAILARAGGWGLARDADLHVAGGGVVAVLAVAGRA